MSTNDSSFPFEVNGDPFEKKLRGVFGKFQTQASYPLYYLLTSIPVDRIDDMRTAAEEFRIEDISFDQMVQRDIDQTRVREIATEYLEMGADRVLFFPPLLLSLVVKNGDGSIKEQYGQVTHAHPGEGNSNLTITWDLNKFRLVLPTSSSNAGTRQIVAEGKEYSYYDFGAQLQYNPREVKLIVLDGQHRLESLRLLRKNPSKKDIIAPIEVPVCIVFAPEAKDQSHESVVKDLRNLFVTVNSEGKQVSGHFLTLLKDNSLAAEVVRSLATLWKDDSTQGYSFLHHLEWNQREERRTAQINRPFSITTIRIIGDTLKTYLFGDGYAYPLLNLASRSKDLDEVAPDFLPSEVSDEYWPHAARDILRDQIAGELVPALSELFRNPKPYRLVQTALEKALAEVDEKANAGHLTYLHLRDRLNKHLYSIEELKAEDSATAVAYEQFESLVEPSALDNIYSTMAFQQGLIRTWIALASELLKFGIAPKHTATALVDALNVMCMDDTKGYCSLNRAYASRTLYRGQRINIGSNGGRDAWQRIIQGVLLHKATRKAFFDSLKRQGIELAQDVVKKVSEQVASEAGQCVDELLDLYFDETFKDIKKHYSDMGYKDAAVKKLRQLEEDDAEGFVKEVRKLTTERYKLAKTELANALDVKPDSLKSIAV